MTRYYFDLINGDGLVRDDVGVELPSSDRVSREVSRILTGIADEEMPARESGTVSIEVRDDEGCPVFVGRLLFESKWLPRES
jgi:hypothetical protein